MFVRNVVVLGIIGCSFTAFILLRGFGSFSPYHVHPILNSQGEPGSVTDWFLRTPYTGSWRGWWSPHGKSWSHWFQDHRHGGGWNKNGWNVLYHVGGNGPWVEMRNGIVSDEVGPPAGCEVEQVHLMSRHHERFPTKHAGERILGMVRRLQSVDEELRGPLEFVKDWQYITEDPESHHEQLTSTGPFAGVLASFTTGVKLRTRYSHLFDHPAKAQHGTPKRTTLWASDSERVISTAQHFAAGFFGLDALSPKSSSPTPAHLIVIPETFDLGADTLTPGDTCLNYRSDEIEGHDLGVTKLHEWRQTYLPKIVARLTRETGAPDLTIEEVYAMQELCGFEVTVRGASPWCAVFKPDEWDGFEYARDVQHFYRSGGGNKYGPVMGWLWLNATADLMRRDVAEEGNGPFFASFVHDGDIVPTLAALDLFPEDVAGGAMSTSEMDKRRKWRASQIVPMGGRVTVEKLNCHDVGTGEMGEEDDEDEDEHLNEEVDALVRDEQRSTKRSEMAEKHYVRINVNDGIVAVPNCSSGPGYSCPLHAFLKRVETRGRDVGVFEQVCGIPLKPNQQRGHITFLHQ